MNQRLGLCAEWCSTRLNDIENTRKRCSRDGHTKSGGEIFGRVYRTTFEATFVLIPN